MRKLIFFITGLLAITSCNEWLDVKPQNQREAEDLFETQAGFEDALIACYIDLNSTDLFGKKLVVTDIEYLAQHWDFGTVSSESADLVKNFDYTSSYAENAFTAIYKKLYNVIAQANSVLDYLPEKGHVIQDTAIRNIIEGEALAARAFCHMEVLRLFGQVPQDATVKVNLPYAKTVSIEAPEYYDFDQFLEQIFTDFNTALSLFSEWDPARTFGLSMLDSFNGNLSGDVFLNCRRFRFNYYAVKALMARLYLYLGQTDKAYDMAMQVINDKLIGELAAVGTTNKALPSECLLALTNTNIKNNMSMFEADGHFLTQTHFNDLFSSRTITTNNRAQNVWNPNDVSNEMQRIARFLKYEQPENETTTEDMTLNKQVVPLIRLSEMYLIAIETAPDLETANALWTPYQEARNEIPVPLTAENLQDEILMEYQREFFGEGQMFYVYKRLKSKNMMWKTDREVSEQDYIVPLPSTEKKV